MKYTISGFDHEKERDLYVADSCGNARYRAAASSSQPRSDKATDTVVSLEQSRDDGVHNLKGCEGVFTASQSRITECRHNETYSRIVSESGLPHSESLTLKKSSDAVPCIRPTLHYKYASHRLHLFSRLNI